MEKDEDSKELSNLQLSENAMKIISSYMAQIVSEVTSMIPKISYKEISEYYIKELEVIRDAIYKKGEQ